MSIPRCVCVWVCVCLCACLCVCMCMYVCVCKHRMVQEVGLSPSAMIILALRWHAVKLADIIVVAIGTIGYLYLNSMLMSP